MRLSSRLGACYARPYANHNTSQEQSLVVTWATFCPKSARRSLVERGLLARPAVRRDPLINDAQQFSTAHQYIQRSPPTMAFSEGRTPSMIPGVWHLIASHQKAEFQHDDMTTNFVCCCCCCKRIAVRLFLWPGLIQPKPILQEHLWAHPSLSSSRSVRRWRYI